MKIDGIKAEQQKGKIVKTVVNVNECWECGRRRILGGMNGKLPKDVWVKARNELDTAQSAVGFALETEHFLFHVVSHAYDRC